MAEKQHKVNEDVLDDYSFSSDFYFQWTSGQVTARISNTTVESTSNALKELRAKTKNRPKEIGVEEWYKMCDKWEDEADELKKQSDENLKKIAELMKNLVKAELAKFDENIKKIQ